MHQNRVLSRRRHPPLTPPVKGGEKTARTWQWLAAFPLLLASAPKLASWLGGGEGPISDLVLFIPAPLFTLAGLLCTVPWLIKKPRTMAWSLLAVQAVFFLITYWNGRGSGTVMEGRVRAMTYNVEYGRLHSAESIVAAIRRQDPDFVFFQESAAPSFRAVFQPALKRLLTGYHTFSDGQMMIASKHPIVSARALPMPGRASKRPLLEVDVRFLHRGDPSLEGPVIRLLCAHLEAVHLTTYFEGKFDAIEKARKGQVDLILERVRASPHPVILGADLNLSPWHREFRRLATVLDDSAHDPFGNLCFTVPAKLPLKKLDYILSKGFDGWEAWVPNENVSDHEPLVADLYGKLDKAESGSRS